ncbi:MAG: NHLP leader peptide family RiPP precursor [Pleurocapsa minor HA4230-MV1]|jgi:hypothetical protein|nr:NHLP leader peptide family RiPP precursor [Pleurocapsa minor HA4230-MV1]
MNQIITQQEAEQAIERIIKRAQTDSEFRQLCLDNPNCAAQEATGKEIPPGYVLKFVDNKRADLTVVLPDIIEESAELSDTELDQVAGGGKCGISCGATGPGGCLCIGIPSLTGL